MSARWRSFKAIVRLWADLFSEHNLLTYASAIAFQALVALVALVLLGIAVLGEIGHADVWTQQIAPHIEPKVLLPVYGGIDATVEHVFQGSSWGLIAFAAALATWEVSGVVRAAMGALAQVYGVEENRPWWIRFPLSVAVALVLTVSLVGAVLLGTAAKGAVGGAWGVPFGIARWLAAIGLVAFGFGVLLHVAPVERRTKAWASAGSALVVGAWLVQSLIFAWWVRDHASYRSAAGSLLGVYVLTTYLYVGAIVLLVGIELDELVRRDLRTGRGEHGIIALALAVVRGTP